MHCPLCRHDQSRVIMTSTGTASIVRVRQCVDCGHRWKTEEIPAELAGKARAVLEGVKALAGTVLP